jgi:uncharacterized protein
VKLNPESLVKKIADGVTIAIRLTPSAAQNKFDRVEMSGEGVMRMRVSVTVVPEKGKANAALIKFLSKTWRLPKSAFSIISGETSRNKALKIEGEPNHLKALIEFRIAELNL